MTRAEEILEAYGIHLTHQYMAQLRSHGAHKKAHKLAHSEAKRLATHVGRETHNSTPGDYNTKRTAAKAAAGKAYHATYDKVYGDFHHAMMR